MPLKFERLMDSIGKKILEALRENARISYSRLGKQVGLSTPAVTERIRKMEEAGIILGYQTRIRHQDPENSILAFVELNAPAEAYDRVKKKARELEEVLECHHVSGHTAFILKVRAVGISGLERVISGFSPFGRTRTSIVMSSSKSQE
jgi:Lrp/AsnC family leucine-responsive transcriptional regulator